MRPNIDPLHNTVEYFNPLWLMNKSNNKDNPTWHKAMTRPHKEGFWKTIQTEINKLKQVEVWEKISQTKDMNVLESTWAFKIKRYPNRTIRKLKARFCVRGYQQIKGVIYFEMYAPAVYW